MFLGIFTNEHDQVDPVSHQSENVVYKGTHVFLMSDMSCCLLGLNIQGMLPRALP